MNMINPISKTNSNYSYPTLTFGLSRQMWLLPIENIDLQPEENYIIQTHFAIIYLRE